MLKIIHDSGLFISGFVASSAVYSFANSGSIQILISFIALSILSLVMAKVARFVDQL